MEKILQQPDLDEIIKELEKKMSNTQKLMLKEFIDIRTGVANPQLLDKIKIPYYGTETYLKNISTINVFEGNQLHITPFEQNLTNEINKAISAAIDITPVNNGKIIKLIFPQPTEEKRRKLIKEVGKIAEKTKIIIRSIRRLGNEQIKKIKLNYDLEKTILKKIQNLNDKWIDSIDKETINKNKELLQI